MPKSFVPPKPIRQLRELLRFRRRLVETVAGVRNRAIKELELAGIKLASLVSDVFGAAGRAMLKALAGSRSYPSRDQTIAYSPVVPFHTNRNTG